MLGLQNGVPVFTAALASSNYPAFKALTLF